jgi:nucleotide-binding universal stress UspA family protein
MTNPTLEQDLGEERQATRAAAMPRGLTGPLLIAGRDDDETSGALRIAELLARRDRLNAHVLTVVPPLPATVGLLIGTDVAPLDEGRRHERLGHMRQRVHQTVGLSVHFSVSAEVGHSASVIATVARERSSALILVGIGAPGAPTRAATEHSALHITRAADVPVLAVPPERETLPRRALVAMDFSEASVRAARTVLLTLAPGGIVTLAHIEPDLDFKEIGKEGWGQIYAEGVDGLFRRLVSELTWPNDVQVERVMVPGDPAGSLLDLAARGDFEIVAAGSRSTPWTDSDPGGSVSATVLRGAAGAVLIAPPHETPA